MAEGRVLKQRILTKDHWEAFRKYGVRKVWIAYDRDDAGERAAEKLGPELNAAGIETWRVLFPKGMDANEYALKVGPADKSLALAVRQATWMGAGKRPTVEVPAMVTPAAPEPTRGGAHAEREAVSAVEVFPSLAALSPAAPPPAAPAVSQRVQDARVVSEAEVQGEEVVFRFGDRRWRVRGLSKNLSYEQLRVNLLLSREDGTFFVDTLELYSARHRASFLKQVLPRRLDDARPRRLDDGHQGGGSRQRTWMRDGGRGARAVPHSDQNGRSSSRSRSRARASARRYRFTADARSRAISMSCCAARRSGGTGSSSSSSGWAAMRATSATSTPASSTARTASSGAA